MRKYTIPEIKPDEILVIEVDNTYGDLNIEEVKQFFNKNSLIHFNEFQVPYKIRLGKISVDSILFEEIYKDALKDLDQIVVFKKEFIQ